MKKAVRMLLALTLSLSMAVGSGILASAEEGSSKENTSESAKETGRNETDEVILASVRDIVPGEGDAYYVSLSAFVWESLTMDNAGTIEPWLASSWEHNDACTEWIIHLRDDVSFTDGVKFNADTCMQNIERYKHGPLTSTYTSLDIKKTFPDLETMEKVDDYTVKFTFSKPITTLEYALADYGSPMISPECFDAETGAITSTVVGTGRYVIAEHEEDQYAVLERNEEYYGENKGKVKRFRIKAIPDSETRYSALLSEEVLSLMDNGAILPKAGDELCKEDERFAMDITKSHMTHYFFLNMEEGPLSDVRMRQAISMAIDREAINESLYGGLLVPAYGILSYQTPFFKEEAGEYNLEKAKELAAEVLQGERWECRVVIRQFKAENYPLKSVAEYCAQVLKELGIDCTIEILDNSVYKEVMASGDYDMDLTTTGLNNADPYSTLEGYLSSKTETGRNQIYHMGYKNERMDELLDEVHGETDADRRMELYGEIQDLGAEELPLIPLFYDVNLNIHNKLITGYTSEYFDGVSLPTIEWAE